jgi:hypothetical protein
VEAGRQPGQAVAHRERAEVHRSEGDRGGLRVEVDLLEHAGELEGAVGGEGQFEQRSGEAAARLDQGDDAAAGDVEALEGALEVVQDLVGQPVVGACSSSSASYARTRFASPCVRMTQVPISVSLVRRSRIRSSSSRVTASVQKSAPRACSAAGSVGASVSGPRTVISATPPRPVDQGADVAVADLVGCPGLRELRKLDAARVGRAVRARGQLGGALGDGLLPDRARHGLVDQPPAHGLRAGHALGSGGEVVGQVTAHVPLVHDPGEAAGARQHPEQRQFGQRDRRGAVVDQHDVLAGQGQLVAAAGRGAVEGGEVGLARVRGGVLHAVAGLVGELAEVHLPRVRGRGEHPDVRAGAEDPSPCRWS